ncbi:uncharacterized, partial [Tachysurus ichikawai]
MLDSWCCMQSDETEGPRSKSAKQHRFVMEWSRKERNYAGQRQDVAVIRGRVLHFC